MQLAAHVRIKPPSVPNASACRAHELLADGRSRRREQLPPMQSSPQDRRSAASERPSGGPASTAATKFMIASVPTSRRRCRCSPSSCSHHLQLKQPNLALEHRRVDVSFSRGLRAGSGSKICLPEVIARCVTAGGHSPRDTLSTLPARRAGRRRFAMSVGRRYLPFSSALRV